MNEEILYLLKRLEDLGKDPVEILQEQLELAETERRLRREQERRHRG